MRAEPGPALTRSARLSACREIGRIHFRTILTYRADFLFGVVILLLQIFLLRVVWTSIYAEQTAVPGSGDSGAISLPVQIAYATLAAFQFWLLNPWANQLAKRIYDGKIAVDLLRPVGLIPQIISAQAGATLALLPFALVAVPFAIFAGGAVAPASSGALLGYIVATFGAYLITLELFTLLGMVAFWTVEAAGAGMIYRLVSQVLSGALVPLWFMPDWLRSLAGVLPFQATTYTPVATYLGKLAGTTLVQALSLQLLWIVVLGLLLRFVWSRALHRVVIHGG